MKIIDDSIVQSDNQNLAHAIKQHVKKHGWYNTAQVLRGVVFVHVGWDSDFTELDNVLRRIVKGFKGEIKEVTDTDHAANDYTEDKLGIPDPPKRIFRWRANRT